MSDARAQTAADVPIIDAATVQRVATLARLELADDERARLGDDLQRMLAYVQQLESIDVRDVAPMIHPTADATPVREDAVAGELSNEQALANAAQSDRGHFVVPRVVG